MTRHAIQHTEAQMRRARREVAQHEHDDAIGDMCARALMYVASRGLAKSVLLEKLTQSAVRYAAASKNLSEVIHGPHKVKALSSGEDEATPETKRDKGESS